LNAVHGLFLFLQVIQEISHLVGIGIEYFIVLLKDDTSPVWLVISQAGRSSSQVASSVSTSTVRLVSRLK
jgi:hypothetical protein